MLLDTNFRGAVLRSTDKRLTIGLDCLDSPITPSLSLLHMPNNILS
jgi:hypothetical protein